MIALNFPPFVAMHWGGGGDKRWCFAETSAWDGRRRRILDRCLFISMFTISPLWMFTVIGSESESITLVLKVLFLSMIFVFFFPQLCLICLLIRILVWFYASIDEQINESEPLIRSSGGRASEALMHHREKSYES